MIRYSKTINGAETNIGYSDSTSMYGDVILTQYSKEGDSLMHWTFVDCWPQTIAEIALRKSLLLNEPFSFFILELIFQFNSLGLIMTCRAIFKPSNLLININ